MKPRSFMLIAGEASGDLLAAELVHALRQAVANQPAVTTADYQPRHTDLAPRFFGAGGPKMAAAGVDLAFDMTEHSVIGLSEVFANFLTFRRLFVRLFQIARQRQPDAIICVDFSGFNRRFVHSIRRYTRAHTGWFHPWQPKLVQYVSPQVWASREGRARHMARDYDLLLSIFPFEQEWYAKRVPQLRVEFVGHPIVDRYAGLRSALAAGQGTGTAPTLLLLPGSRPGELRRHLPVMIDALALIQAKVPGLCARMVLPQHSLFERAKVFRLPPSLQVQVGGLPEALGAASVAVASTGTVTTECAYFGVPTVALYKTSWTTYHVARQLVKVKYLAMPNLLANEPIFPEFIQAAATPDNLARAAVDLLRDEPRRAGVKVRLAEIVSSLGSPGAPRRAAQAILQLLSAEGEARREP